MRFEITKRIGYYVLPLFFFSFTLKFSENVTEQGYKNLSTWVKDLVYYVKKKTTSFFFLDVTIIITILEIWLFFLNITVT